ncbi:MAG: bacillithiol system redox-active protein YtxJ [Polaribacter sp.]|nr:bacillithiol system redox-active protein YtxJ [Polaribacter sp.]
MSLITNWKILEDVSYLETIIKESENKSILIFKHSTRCGISTMVLNRFDKLAQNYQNQYQFYYLDLLNYRNISNEIESIFRVEHQSPQILIIKMVILYSILHIMIF